MKIDYCYSWDTHIYSKLYNVINDQCLHDWTAAKPKTTVVSDAENLEICG